MATTKVRQRLHQALQSQDVSTTVESAVVAFITQLQTTLSAEYPNMQPLDEWSICQEAVRGLQARSQLAEQKATSNAPLTDLKTRPHFQWSEILDGLHLLRLDVDHSLDRGSGAAAATDDELQSLRRQALRLSDLIGGEIRRRLSRTQAGRGGYN